MLYIQHDITIISIPKPWFMQYNVSLTNIRFKINCTLIHFRRLTKIPYIRLTIITTIDPFIQNILITRTRLDHPRHTFKTITNYTIFTHKDPMKTFWWMMGRFARRTNFSREHLYFLCLLFGYFLN
jgi:hypothetical protein